MGGTPKRIVEPRPKDRMREQVHSQQRTKFDKRPPHCDLSCMKRSINIVISASTPGFFTRVGGGARRRF